MNPRQWTRNKKAFSGIALICFLLFPTYKKPPAVDISILLQEVFYLMFDFTGSIHLSVFFILVFSSLGKKITVFVIKLLESSLVKRPSYLFHKVVIEVKIVKNGKTHTKCLACLEKVPDIRS